MPVVMDFHQTSLLEEQLFKEKEDQLEGTIRLIFPNQQKKFRRLLLTFCNRTGLEGMFEELLFHNMPQLKAGQLALNAGAMMAGSRNLRSL